jgi:hypothetical protein
MSNEPEFYRPDESDRLARAKEWLRVARGGEKPAPERATADLIHCLTRRDRDKSEAE